MSTFDESSVRRQPGGVSTGGQFATKPRSEPDVALSGGYAEATTAYYVEPIGFGDGVYGPFDDEFDASAFIDDSEFLGDETHRVVLRES